MRHPFLGFTSTLAALTFIYIAAWIIDIGGPSAAIADDSYPVSIVILPVVAAIYSTVMLLLVILPQVLLARFIVRRSRCHQMVPFLIFFSVSALLLAPVALLYSSNGPIWTMGSGITYLVAGSSVLWHISFRHECSA